MKTTNELKDIIQNLRDALIEAKATAWAYKNSVHAIPAAVSERLAEMEADIEKVLENNKAW